VVRDKSLLAGASVALDRLTASRREEGTRLAPVVGGHLDEIDRLCVEARDVAALQPAAIHARVSQAAAELMGAVPALSPERLAQESRCLLSRPMSARNSTA